MVPEHTIQSFAKFAKIFDSCSDLKNMTRGRVTLSSQSQVSSPYTAASTLVQYSTIQYSTVQTVHRGLHLGRLPLLQLEGVDEPEAEVGEDEEGGDLAPGVAQVLPPPHVRQDQVDENHLHKGGFKNLCQPTSPSLMT